ncbi:MAG: 16S rRNA processing protein RimM [Balneolaceae bacterium]|nr:MAG: 16S rRNA processing protein RimM [Balneolaceae bacterium]
MAKEPSPGLYPLGIIAKAQGTRGGFLMEVNDPAAMMETPDLLYFRYPDSQWVPYRVEEIRPQQAGKRSVFFVILEGITTRTEAEQLRGLEVKTDRFTESSPDPDNVTGYTVLRSDETRMGEVADLMETPAYRILVVQASDRIVLIPWMEQFVVGVDDDSRTIRTRNTEDLETLE